MAFGHLNGTFKKKALKAIHNPGITTSFGRTTVEKFVNTSSDRQI